MQRGNPPPEGRLIPRIRIQEKCSSFVFFSRNPYFLRFFSQVLAVEISCDSAFLSPLALRCFSDRLMDSNQNQMQFKYRLIAGTAQQFQLEMRKR
jgi:hypothetical protein